MSARKVIVTGGTAGIGLAIARCLLDRGHSVFVCGRSNDKLTDALAQLSVGTEPRRLSGSTCDVRQLTDVQAMVELACHHLGGIDCLVNNAGISFIKDFEEFSPAMWSEIVQTNLTGIFNCCHAALPALKLAATQLGVADIVNIGSRSGRYSFRGGVGYNTTKFGVQGLTEAMFLDLNRYGIRVGLVAPGTVATGLAGQQPADWHLQPEDVGKAVAYMMDADPRACANWIEIRPARPQG